MINPYVKYLVNSIHYSKLEHSLSLKLNNDVFSHYKLIDDVAIKTVTNRLRQNDSVLKITDLGAGSKTNKSSHRKISDILKSASITQKDGKLLSQIIHAFKCKTVIELGTSFGIGTSYLSVNNPLTQIYTVEGCPNISNIAKETIKELKVTNVNFYTGEFSAQLPQVVKDSGLPDLVYIDGNHTYKATLDYFEFFCNHASKQTILVFDDIHWSKGMEKAWKEICASNSARLTLDLFRIGIVFLDADLEKKHAVIRYK